ncbi:MAG: FAD-dependent oxidoreductase [Henriciella sp.]|jgi:glycine/D-amino acid oxidase-like deaminating enzyme|uniref:FAD-dependent oxidoreductase n=1 Tax=Henriciella sp. TaxID=1968823 RepID=UPI000C0DD454|nr:FAD-dependent oxidoreductase [Henriciella sp.]MAN74549.1 FAD-dependent oxidoreductase [Henriciella sp.]MBF32661.1 FAD-dependent oxidoreductase [Hyphomonadaceae bacterium]PHR72946.1 MAG: FAD-dependent oxidoreductase [Henriciella sp.]|tara:strand:+ start:3751 stop:4887 length:1137 start_codon:yes stop_codon:yes gene_type:complete
MRRREFVSGLGLATLGACATAPSASPVQASAGPDPYANYVPVNSTMSRVTRTVVGLRPYRPAGYRLETERLGDKTVIHNYGHGGCGVTMSWGTASVAADEASATGQRDIAVLGCGVQGLTSALILARRGHNVTIYAENLPPHTTSNVAGVLWMPTGYFDYEHVSREWLAMNRKLIRLAYYGFLPYVNRPGYGVYWADHHSLGRRVPTDRKELPGGDDIYPELRMSTENNLFGYAYQERFKAMIIDPDYYLDAILQDAQLAGARTERVRFASVEDVMALDEKTIVNCTGLGASQIFGDEQLMPVKGQLSHLLPQPDVTYSYVASTSKGVLYMFPRKTGLVLGGTHIEGDGSMEVDPAQVTRMVEGHAELASRLRAPATA